MKRILPTFAFLILPAMAMAAEFDGYPCQTTDCSGHRAGYAWAARRNITNLADCTGKSQSFIEGCWAYASGGSGRTTQDISPAPVEQDKPQPRKPTLQQTPQPAAVGSSQVLAQPDPPEHLQKDAEQGDAAA